MTNSAQNHREPQRAAVSARSVALSHPPGSLLTASTGGGCCIWANSNNGTRSPGVLVPAGGAGREQTRQQREIDQTRSALEQRNDEGEGPHSSAATGVRGSARAAVTAPAIMLAIVRSSVGPTAGGVVVDVGVQIDAQKNCKRDDQMSKPYPKPNPAVVGELRGVAVCMVLRVVPEQGVFCPFFRGGDRSSEAPVA